MKKLLLAVVLGLLFVAAFSTLALADNGPHGGFNGSTDACASCHRAHSAQSTDGMLLVASDVYTLCTNCHDGTGAYTNVVDGYYDTNTALGTDPATTADPGKSAFAGGWGEANVGLFGGGFEYARMLTDYGNASNEAANGLASITTNAAADQNASTTSWARMNAYDSNSTLPLSRAVTSNHGVSAVGRTGTVWGSGGISATAFSGGTFTGASELECTSCHDPHGNAGRQGGLAAGAAYPSYRLLRFTPEGSNGFEVAGQVSATGYWDTDMPWAAASGLSGAVVPEAAGVLVPDRTTKWYSVNTDITLDPSLGAYSARSSVAAPSIYVAIFAGRGDYMGRYYGYRRPAATAGTAAGGGATSYTSCAPTSGAVTPCGAATGPAFNNTPSHDALGFWCATCHDRYLAPGGTGTGSRTTDSGDALYHYRHRSQGLSNTSFGAGQYTCVDCHNAHGTAATASSTLASNASYATGSVLLKADNRAICTRCHAAAVNFFNVSTSPTAPMVVP
jgi:predicted CXXCH cytochrome family protein